ncbi:MAG: hypothetical protein GXO55_04975 [Chloroflexi bacterium]|nr:hypothetical protein [Chloroflexota bacterium]
MEGSLFEIRHADPLPQRWLYPLLAALVVLYLVIGIQFALKTPLWQVPDEPAHVNYALHIARTGTLPILRPGDYDAAYLEAIKAAKFPPDMSVASIRYEFHQPPAYYLLGGALLRALVPDVQTPNPPPYVLERAVHTLRLLSLVLSVGILLFAFATARVLFPQLPSVALAVVACIAFIPQHVAMMTGANNDALAELMLALFLWLLTLHTYTPPAADGSRWLGRGVILGLILLTKTTIYAPALLALVAFHVLRAWPGKGQNARWRAEGKAFLLEVLVALFLASPFFLHNVRAYGWPDVLGWQRHAQVVAGQMTPGEYIAQNGKTAYAHRAVTWTFRSFWGQFGWMGVLMDARIYKGLMYLTALLFVGIGIFLAHGCRPRFERVLLRRKSTAVECLIEEQHNALGVLSAAAVGTWIAYVGYNLSYLQHQGRYLFTGLVPLAIISLPGIWILLEPKRAAKAMWVTALLGWGALLLALGDVGPVDRWDALSLFGMAFWFGFAKRFPRLRPLWLLLPFLSLALLDVWALYAYIIPMLTR